MSENLLAMETVGGRGVWRGVGVGGGRVRFALWWGDVGRRQNHVSEPTHISAWVSAIPTSSAWKQRYAILVF